MRTATFTIVILLVAGAAHAQLQHGKMLTCDFCDTDETIRFDNLQQRRILSHVLGERLGRVDLFVRRLYDLITQEPKTRLDSTTKGGIP